MSKARKVTGRRKRSAADRLRPFWILLLLFLAVGILGGYYVITWPGFRVRHIIVFGNHRVTSKEIIRRAALNGHVNIWLQNMNGAANRIVAIPNIGQVTIQRAFPAGVTIVVRERIPFAQIRSGSQSVVSDRDLRVLKVNGAAGLPQFVIRIALPPVGQDIKDERVVRLRDDYERLTDAHVVIVALRYDRFGDLIALTPRRVQILLGDDEDLVRKVSLIGPILSQTAGKKLAAIDLRAPGTPVVVYRR
jgi:cell division septal protein FtsQ